ncbi:MAG: SH3 domain-containing protein [Pelagibacteraceae bacterium]|jgi:SH3-like domain-containing protein
MQCKKLLKFLIFFLVVQVNFVSVNAEEYFLTLRNNTTNLRQGPSFDYPIKIFYKKKYLPVLIIDSSDNFRKIKDHENNTGWIHVSQLSKKKAAIVISEKSILFKNDTVYSNPLAVLAQGRLCIISKCNDEWCKIKTDKFSGWTKKDNLWGNL